MGINNALLESLKQQLLKAMGILERFKGNQTKLYEAAVSFLGKDASPADIAKDEVSCVESISKVLQKAFPELRFPDLLSTRDLYSYLSSSPSFQESRYSDFGTIILSVTGTGNGKVKNGHVGVVGKYNAPDDTAWIISLNSPTGTMEVNYTLASWRRRYEEMGGLYTVFFRVV